MKQKPINWLKSRFVSLASALAMVLALGVQAQSVTTDLVSLAKSQPAKVAVGEEFTVTLTVTAQQDVTNVVVKDEVPSGATLVSTQPTASTSGSALTWNIGDLAAGESKELMAVIKPTGEGELKGCATVSAEPKICVSTMVGKPALEIVKSGPEQALINSEVTYAIKVSNTGSYIAKNVVITDTVPEGMTHSSGQKTVAFEVGDLAPGESRDVNITLTATARGKHCNVATATSSNTSQATDDACTTVVERGLEIVKTGTEKQYAGKKATYTITATNTGDVTLTNVVITDNAPVGTRILEAEGATINGNTATWNVGELASKASVSKTLTLTSAQSGELCNKASIASAEGLTGSASACTLWTGHPALLIEVVDTVDPLLPDEETSYLVKVTNQGTAPDTNVNITANFPAEISPIEAGGDTKTTINGKTVNTEAYPVLAPKQAIQWTIKAKAQQTGDSRLKVQLRSDLLKTPVTEEESTQVY